MCTSPLRAYRLTRLDPETGKKEIVWSEPRENYEVLLVPCNQCLECRLKRSREWAMRCMHEAKKYDNNMFITLTYSPELSTAEQQWTLNKTDFTLFQKRYRKKYGKGIRFFHCGEYGDKFSRPHHHAIIFNHWLPDAEPVAQTSDGFIYGSRSLQELWRFGFVSIGAVTFESCAYVARYVTKKLTGQRSAEYQGKLSEFCTMSRRPGIGADYVGNFGEQILRLDSVITPDGSREFKPPRYYVNRLEQAYPEAVARLKENRILSQLITGKEVKEDEQIYRDYQKNLEDFCARHELSVSKAEMRSDCPKFISSAERRANYQEVNFKQKMQRKYEK